MAKDGGKPKFIRKKGKIIPIGGSKKPKPGEKRPVQVKKPDPDKKKIVKKPEKKKFKEASPLGDVAAVGAAGAGALTIEEQSRTRRVFVDDRKGITIDKTTGARRRLGIKRDATELTIRRMGKKAGFANIGKGASKSDFTFNFLRIGKKHQRQGLSKVLSEEAGREIKRQGGKTTTNQVIHKGSALSNFRRGKDRFVDDLGKRISKKNALGEIELFQELGAAKQKIRLKGSRKRFSDAIKFGGKRSTAKSFLGAAQHAAFPDAFNAKDSGVFRETSLKGVRKMGKHSTKAFISGRGKALIGLGALGIAGGTSALFRDRKKKKRRK